MTTEQRGILAIMIACIAIFVAVIATSNQGPNVGTYPHCRYGIAHAYGSQPQCSMPQP